MAGAINIYCDESGHLEHDHQRVMVLGAVWCATDRASDAATRLREIKAKHGLPPNFEIKWGKVSPAKKEFYLDILDYFFDDDLHFRAVVIPDKRILDHDLRRQTHDDWYYKMYFEMLRVIIDPDSKYRIYIDIKDTRGGQKIRKLHDVLCNAHYDFAHRIVLNVQLVRSHEVQLIQLADLLTGVLAYANRGGLENAGKVALVRRMQERSRYTLTRTTWLRSNKVNILRWEPDPAQ